MPIFIQSLLNIKGYCKWMWTKVFHTKVAVIPTNLYPKFTRYA